MSTEPSFRVPEKVRHAEFLAAIKPLLDLCGVSANEVYADIHITGTSPGSTSLNRITFNVVVPAGAVVAVDDDTKSVPASLYQEHSELSVQCTVEVA